MGHGAFSVSRAHVNLIEMSSTRLKSQLMTASEIDRTLVRLAHEVLEKTTDLDKLAFVGIKRRGVPLATRLAAKITLTCTAMI